MSLTRGDILTTITCDKCGYSQMAPKEEYNTTFFESGWAFNRGRKYMHLCNECLPAKSRRAMKFIQQLFG